jgi:hypothetical protein
MELKWTKKEPYERSRRPTKQTQKESPVTSSYEAFSDELAISAYSSSLNHDENTWDILNQSIYNEFKNTNKREDLDDKISQRELIQQRGTNPFLQNTNYLNDMNVRDTYLKPRNTTLDREKNNKNEN